MHIAVLSDTHDNWPTLDRVCDHLNRGGVTCLIHCGDVCAPLTLGHLLEAFRGQVHLAFGNVDGDPFLMASRFADCGHLCLHGAEGAHLELGGRRIGVQHYPSLARGLAATGDYDVVFHGHDHDQAEHRLEAPGRRVLLANPGNLAAMGKPRTFCVYDTDGGELEVIDADHL